MSNQQSPEAETRGSHSSPPPCSADNPPPPKKGWNHSEQVLVYYQASDHEAGLSAGYGIAYFHHDPPHAGPKWVDFDNYGRDPLCWWPLPLPPNEKSEARR